MSADWSVLHQIGQWQTLFSSLLTTKSFPGKHVVKLWKDSPSSPELSEGDLASSRALGSREVSAQGPPCSDSPRYYFSILQMKKLRPDPGDLRAHPIPETPLETHSYVVVCTLS